MATIAEILKEYKKLKSEKKRTVTEAIELMLHGCQTCKTVDNILRVGDVVTVKNRTSSAWNNRTGTIESFEIVQQGTIMWFIGYHGHLYGCTIKKLCPECLKLIHEFEF